MSGCSRSGDPGTVSARLVWSTPTGMPLESVDSSLEVDVDALAIGATSVTTPLELGSTNDTVLSVLTSPGVLPYTASTGASRSRSLEAMEMMTLVFGTLVGLAVGLGVGTRVGDVPGTKAIVRS